MLSVALFAIAPAGSVEQIAGAPVAIGRFDPVLFYAKESGQGCGGLARNCVVRLHVGVGGTYKSRVGANTSECATTCDGSADCAGFEYDRRATTCSFKSVHQMRPGCCDSERLLREGGV